MKERLSRIRHIVMDMDGTIYLGSKIFPFTLDFLELLKRKGIGYTFLTNNPTRSPEDYLKKLSAMGIPCTAEQMLTTSQAAVEYIRRHMPAVKRVYVLGTQSLQNLFASNGYTLQDEDCPAAPDLLVVSFPCLQAAVQGRLVGKPRNSLSCHKPGQGMSYGGRNRPYRLRLHPEMH